MPRTMQNIILVIYEPIIKYETPEKIGYQYMNRIAIDEEAAFEIRKVLKLRKSQGMVYLLLSNVLSLQDDSCVSKYSKKML